MISRIKGIMVEKNPSSVLIDVMGIGYEILIPTTTFYQLGEINSDIILHTHFIVREDSQQLFGFISKDDRSVFRELIKVNGVGAKMGLAILSGMDLKTLLHSFENHDYKLLCSIPGIGQKTAERLVVELKDKLKKLINSLSSEINLAGEIDHGPKNNLQINKNKIVIEAINALESLNFKTKDAEKYVDQIKNNTDNLEDMIRLALKQSIKSN